MSDDGLTHPCSIMCRGHDTVRGTNVDLATDFADAMVDSIGPVLCINKHTKIYSPLAFVTLLGNLPLNAGVKAYQRITYSQLHGHSAAADRAALANGTGCLTTEHLQVRERVRARKPSFSSAYLKCKASYLLVRWP